MDDFYEFSHSLGLPHLKEWFFKELTYCLTIKKASVNSWKALSKKTNVLKCVLLTYKIIYIMKAEFLEEISKLNDKQQQLLKDTINFGGWGDTDMTFLDKEGNHETTSCYVYVTNDAKKGKHFNGRQVSAMFRAIYKKLCVERIVPQEGIGYIFTHISDWWGDGSGDVLFIRKEFYPIATEWAKE